MQSSAGRLVTRLLAVSLGLVSLGIDPAAQASTSGSLGWTSQLVEHVGRADDFSLTRTFIDVGPSGRATILYCDGPNASQGFDLRLARGPRADGSFHRESIDPADQLITGSASLALDAQGLARVSYVSGVYQDQGILKYAEETPTGWTIEVADPVKSTAQTALALDTLGNPVIAYTKTDGELRVATRGPTGWVSSEIAHANVVALDLAVDAADHPRIAYIAWDGSSYVLRLASFDGTTWSSEQITQVASQGIEFGVELLIDRSGHAEMVFPVLEPVQGLAFAHHTRSGWQVQRVSTGDLWQPSATVDEAGTVYVVFYDATQGALRYGRRVDGRWHLRTLADSSSPWVRIGREASIALDSHGVVHVSYYVGKASRDTTLRYGTVGP